MLRALTAFGRKSFYCDSHPRLCIHCKRLRKIITTGKDPNLVMVNTTKGPYLWTHFPRGIKVKVIFHG